MEDGLTIVTKMQKVMRNNSFTENDMRISFVNLKEVVSSEGKINLAIALGSSEPILLKDNIIELLLSNTSQQELVEDHKYMILEFLRDSLKNETVELKSKVLAVIKDNVPYTNKDKYKKILTEYPNLKKLSDQLGLDPEY